MRVFIIGRGEAGRYWSRRSRRLVPIEIFVIFNVSVPVLVMVTLWGALTVPTF